MTDPVNSTFLVDAYSDPVLVRVLGRASFVNSSSLREFTGEMMRQGRRRFVVDFSECTGMDSTFLGVLAGLALDLRKSDPKGTVVFCRLAARNLELIRNLGLHRLAMVDFGGDLAPAEGTTTPLEDKKLSELENARMCLEAHENLIEADQANQEKFQDVLVFMKNRVDQG
ncbi:MAG: anti-sigma factor antagonist [Verrucomicrobia bacterium]|nr:MAG: anti-sigma factor antagonist [Verrucomicrobiota bacterium]